MRAHGVIAVLPDAQCSLSGGEVQVAVIALPEFLGVGTVGAFHAAVEPGAAGRQHEKTEAACLACSLEVGHKFTAAVHLDSPKSIRVPGLEIVQKLGGGGSRGARPDAHHTPAGDDIYRRKLLEHHARQRPEIHGIYLYQVSGRSDGIVLRFAHGLRTEERPFVRGDCAAKGLMEFAGRLELGQAIQALQEMRPTIETETCQSGACKREASFSLPHRGFSLRNWQTAATRSGDQVGWRTCRVRWVRLSRVLSTAGHSAASSDRRYQDLCRSDGRSSEHSLHVSDTNPILSAAVLPPVRAPGTKAGTSVLGY